MNCTPPPRAATRSKPSREGLDVYLPPACRMRVYSIDPTRDDLANELRELAVGTRTVFVADRATDQADLAALWAGEGTISRIWQYTRPGAETSLELWELMSAERPHERGTSSAGAPDGSP